MEAPDIPADAPTISDLAGDAPKPVPGGDTLEASRAIAERLMKANRPDG